MLPPSFRKLVAGLVLVPLVAAACGGDDDDDAGAQTDTTVAADEEMSEDEMSDEEMSDEEMSDDEMAEDEMAEDEMADDEMADDEMAEDEMAEDEMAEDGDVLAVAAHEDDLTVFLAALEASGTMDDFHGEGPFTIFAPSDAAFEAYLEGAGMDQAALLAESAMLQGILDHHVVNMMDDAEMVMGMDGQSFTTAAGTELAVTVDGDTVMVGEATIERYDLTASNGVIHVIDTVLTPPES